MKYAKIINGELEYHGTNNPIVNVDGTVTVTSDVDLLSQHGFYPVTNTPMPQAQDGYHYEHSYNVVNGTITDVWTQVENEPAEPSEKEMLGDVIEELSEQIKELSKTNSMIEECLLEMSMIVYE